MAMERAHEPRDDDRLTPDQEARIDRALADSAAGRVYDNVTTEALERFVALDEAEARSLLADPDALRLWLASHA